MLLRICCMGLAFSVVSFYGQFAHALNLSGVNQGTNPLIVRVQASDSFSVKNIDAITSPLIPLKVNLPASIKDSTKKTWLRIIGLPDGLKFSAGVIVNGIWFIPSQDAGKLGIELPEKYIGDFSLDIFLMREDRPVVSIVGKQTVKVRIRKKVIKPVQAPPKKIVRISRSEENILLERAAELMRLGTFAPARLIYEELANQGSAKGARELAKTYDPNYSASSSISGMAPDADLAAKWYEKAKQLAIEFGE